MSRLRTAAQRAPQTTEQALVLASRFAEIATTLGELAARRNSLIARVDAICAARVVPLEAEQADIVKRLKPWFAANFEELTGGKRKSIDFGGAHLGYRINPPKVHYANGTDDAAATALIDNGLDDDLVRTKHSPDKPAILKLLELIVPEATDGPRDDELAARLATKRKLEDLGFSVKQPELFFVDVAAKQEPAAAIVASDDEVQHAGR